MANLKDKLALMEQKQGELNELFVKHKDAEGGYDMAVEVIEEVNRRNDELKSLAQEIESLRQLEAIEAKNREALDAGRQVKRPEFSGDQKPDDEKTEIKDLGQLFIESQAFKGYTPGNERGPESTLDMELKTLFQTGAGWAPQAMRGPRVELYPTRPAPTVSDLVAMTTTQQPAVVYMEETTFTNAAAEAGEGGAYGEAALALTERTSNVRKIAVWLPVTDEQLEDEPRAREYVNNRLTLMLNQRLDAQILSGNGVAPNLEGILTNASVQSQAKGADPTPDAIYKGIIKVQSVGFAVPDAVVFHPNDWQDVRLLRTTDGIYIWGNPSERGPDYIWGLPVVLTTAETENTAIVGSFRQYAEIALRRGVQVQISDSHDTYFVNGKKAIRADFRAALVIYRPKAFCKVTGI